jgi:hypothetical protein
LIFINLYAWNISDYDPSLCGFVAIAMLAHFLLSPIPVGDYASALIMFCPSARPHVSGSVDNF